jgi:hypothetical protein
MATHYGIRTQTFLDRRLKHGSTVAKYLDAHGVNTNDANTVRILNIDIDDDDLTAYNEASITGGMTPTLVEFGKQEWSIDYNYASFLRIQDTQLQDIPVGSAVSDVAKAWVDEKFVPDFDEYALAKIIAARPSGNIVTWDGTTIDNGVNGLLQKFYNTVTVVTNGGGDTSQSIAWVPSSFADKLRAYITTFDGSDKGYTAGTNGLIGQLKGVMIVETVDAYFDAYPTVKAVIADKRAIAAPTQKMTPKNGGRKFIKDVAGFGGSELQLRARGGVFVMNRKVDAIATLQTSSS